MNILLVEDNEIIGKSISVYLKNKGYKVERILDGEEAIDSFENSKYNLIVLDWMLPGFDGISILDHVRNISDIPVIITTAKSELDDKKEGFDTGADDFLVKPFELEELYIRIKNLLKRSNQIESVLIGNIELFLGQYKVTKNGEKINLTNKEFLILEYLVKHIGIVVSRTEIIDYIWGEESVFESDDKLDVYISNIRKKTYKHLIETIKGFGYKIEKEKNKIRN
ncbi:response regulator transcription factor [Candidatus Vampirococcus lugosii]|uniref:PhoB family transcriptional regulator n=1 Tax=Candidatus Vampirococcus lugosii TaxID=2789015 RepID=A0ABS5QMP0_9BACT|nr:response regulator transcription factor [Candidatus Vampirococcus lugosii]MBS8122480.1 PhoB family transcriptional regulator [Candidatus Vampirococcus lugosii]